MWDIIAEFINAYLIITGLIYFIDIQTDGKIDLPHRVWKIDDDMGFGRLWKKLQKR